MSRQSTSLVVNFRKMPSSHWHLGVVAKRTYVVQGETCKPAEKQEPLLLPAAEPTASGSFRDKDTYGAKPTTDVVVHGSAYCAGREVSSLVASIDIGELSRRVRVHGDRTVTEVRGTEVSFSRPLAFTRIPLSYERSYGGFDEHAARVLGDDIAESAQEYGVELADASKYTYPRNARGVGFSIAIDPQRIWGAAVPNLEDPDDPVLPSNMLRQDALDWIGAPIPGALDWVLPSDFPRSVHFNLCPAHRLPAAPIREIALGALTLADMRERALLDELDARAANGAAPGLARIRLVGGEQVRLVHMHPERREVLFNLPAEAPEISIKPPGCPSIPVEPLLDTVYLEPDVGRVSLVWSGSLRVASRYPPAELAQVEHEVRW